MLNMHTSNEDSKAIIAIMLRAASLISFDQLDTDRLSVTMDLSACHVNGCPLDLAGLLASSNGDFLHDVCGIIQHIDRKTGALRNCFLPRYALMPSEEIGIRASTDNGR